MFQMPVIEVPTNLPNVRVDLPIQAFAVRGSICIIYQFDISSLFIKLYIYNIYNTY